MDKKSKTGGEISTQLTNLVLNWRRNTALSVDDFEKQEVVFVWVGGKSHPTNIRQIK